MNFWELDQVIQNEILSFDTSVQVRKTKQGQYVYEFEVNDKSGNPLPYSVVLNKTALRLPNNEILSTNGWDIALNGPKGYEIVGNSNPFDVYQKVVSAIRSLSQIEQVDGLTFGAHHGAMFLVYDRIRKRFLPDFTQVDPYKYVRTELLQQYFQQHPEQKASLEAEIKTSQQEYEQEINKMRDGKKMIKNSANWGNLVIQHTPMGFNKLGLLGSEGVLLVDFQPPYRLFNTNMYGLSPEDVEVVTQANLPRIKSAMSWQRDVKVLQKHAASEPQKFKPALQILQLISLP